MIDHVSITVPDLAPAARFYDAVMATLGVPAVGRDDTWLGYGLRADAAQPGRSYLSVRQGEAPGDAAGRHWCFKAPDRAAVDGFWRAGLAAGGADDGPPGLRPHYHPHYYAAFLRDPAGNRIEAVCHEAAA
ncbi:VOC family protein [Paracraurococcus ruber]|uniref:Glyoxalase n=1 Tax=Paracraurococcus ruber TaxID=77675 RepID=A0ABS1CWR5_9PROT|nr:VOC family protein [Paracraurococcus ruber]MBK1658902.1 glyoxalase [Paracraurococcus ruber]TDG30856.1 VOC family protein [Paracraurococcus ruber]